MRHYVGQTDSCEYRYLKGSKLDYYYLVKNQLSLCVVQENEWCVVVPFLKQSCVHEKAVLWVGMSLNGSSFDSVQVPFLPYF